MNAASIERNRFSRIRVGSQADRRNSALRVYVELSTKTKRNDKSPRAAKTAPTESATRSPKVSFSSIITLALRVRGAAPVAGRYETAGPAHPDINTRMRLCAPAGTEISSRSTSTHSHSSGLRCAELVGVCSRHRGKAEELPGGQARPPPFLTNLIHRCQRPCQCNPARSGAAGNRQFSRCVAGE